MKGTGGKRVSVWDKDYYIAGKEEGEREDGLSQSNDVRMGEGKREKEKVSDVWSVCTRLSQSNNPISVVTGGGGGERG